MQEFRLRAPQWTGAHHAALERIMRRWAMFLRWQDNNVAIVQFATGCTHGYVYGQVRAMLPPDVIIE